MNISKKTMSQNSLIIEIKELLGAIDRDIYYFAQGDSMNYTGYLAENAQDLQFLISALLNQGA
jgi:hypothetical protein